MGEEKCEWCQASRPASVRVVCESLDGVKLDSLTLCGPCCKVSAGFVVVVNREEEKRYAN